MNQRKLYAALAGCCLLVALPAALRAADQPPYETKEFAMPGIKWKPVPLWFWNNTTIQATTLEKQLCQMVEKDNYGGGAILPFGEGFRPEYLSETYFELYRRALDNLIVEQHLAGFGKLLAPIFGVAAALFRGEGH